MATTRRHNQPIGPGHPFYGGRIILGMKPPKNWKEKVAVSRIKDSINELKTKDKLSPQDSKLLESYKKDLSQAEIKLKIAESAERIQEEAGDRCVNEETSTGDEQEDSKNK